MRTWRWGEDRWELRRMMQGPWALRLPEFPSQYGGISFLAVSASKDRPSVWGGSERPVLLGRTRPTAAQQLSHLARGRLFIRARPLPFWARLG